MGSHLKCVEMLVQSGVKTNELNDSLGDMSMPVNGPNDESIVIGKQCTPLMLACVFDQDGLVVRELVLNANAKVNVTDKNGYNTLHYAALQGNRNVLEIVSSNVLKLLNSYPQRQNTMVILKGI